jgi:hypothetical protein
MDSSVLIAPVHTPAVLPAASACANCDTARMGEYCYACGQHFLEGRFTIRRLVRDFLVRKMGLEGGLLRTAVDLSIRPSRMMREYVNGRRQRYTNPVAYLLLTAALYVLLSRFWSDAMAAGLRSDPKGLDGMDAEAMVQVQMYMDSHPSVTTVVLCLFLVPVLRLLFRRSTSLAEASVFSLFISGHLLLMQVVINLGALLLAADMYRVMTGWVTALPALVFLLMAGRFFGARFSTSLKMAVAVVVSSVAVYLLMVIAAASLSALATAAA